MDEIEYQEDTAQEERPASRVRDFFSYHSHHQSTASPPMRWLNWISRAPGRCRQDQLARLEPIHSFNPAASLPAHRWTSPKSPP